MSLFSGDSWFLRPGLPWRIFDSIPKVFDKLCRNFFNGYYWYACSSNPGISMIRTAERIRAWLMKTYLNHLPTLWRLKTATALEGVVPDCCNPVIGYLLNPATSLNGILLSDSILYLAPAIPLCRKPGLIDNHLYKYDQNQGRPNTCSVQRYYPVKFQIKNTQDTFLV